MQPPENPQTNPAFRQNTVEEESGAATPFQALQLRSPHHHALHSIEAALQHSRASTQDSGASGDATVGFEQTESHHRASAQGLRLPKIPQLPKGHREMSRLASRGWPPTRVPHTQCFHDFGTQPESRLRQPQKRMLKVDQSSCRRIGQKTRRARDSKAKRGGHFASSSFIEDQEAVVAMLPCQRDRRSLSGIQCSRFLQIRNHIGNHGNPIRHCRKQASQILRRTDMHRLAPDGLGHGDLAIKPAQQIQFADFGQARKHGIVTDDDHWTARRNSNDLRASSTTSSAECAGHAPSRESAACASQRDSSSSNLRTCSNERTSFAYASAAKASRAARPRFLKPAPSSAAKSSGMFTVKVIARNAIPSGINLQTRKPPTSPTVH